jgi:quercetin dioxygenase-like cupin family protein
MGHKIAFWQACPQGRQYPEDGMNRSFALLCGLCLVSGAALAQGAPKPNFAFNNPIPNIPGKSLLAVVVDYPPGVSNPPHRHARSAFVTAYVLEGAVRSQVDDGPVKVYHAGEYFTENPGAHHRLSENASKTEPAKMLAIFVLDTGDMPLSTPDK